MRKYLIFLALTISFLVVVPSVNALPMSVESKQANFTISDSFITVGESFHVGVSVFDDGTLGDLTSFGFDVPQLESLSILSFDGYSLGAGFDDGFSGGIYFNGLYDPFSGSNAGQDVLLVNLSFTALGVGEELLEVSGLFDGLTYGLFYANEMEFYDRSIAGSFSIKVNEGSAPVPEPTTLLLLGTGLASLAGFVRKKK